MIYINYELKIYNLSGQSVKKFNSINNEKSVDISNLLSGIHTILTKRDGIKSHNRFVKME